MKLVFYLATILLLTESLLSRKIRGDKHASIRSFRIQVCKFHFIKMEIVESSKIKD